MFSFFENKLNPFRISNKINQLRYGGSTADFLLGQITELQKYILLVIIVSASMAFSEVYLFNLLGGIVDLLVSVGNEQKGLFFFQNKWMFIKACFILLVCLPFVVSVHTFIINQTLYGNVQTRIMSQTNELLIQQNLPFFTSIPSGKLAAVVLQLSGATQYVLMKAIDIFVYILVFFISASLLIIKANWILLAPICLWAVGYVYAMTKYIPELKKRAEVQADRRSDVNANLVDVFSNILMVKMFMGENHEVKFSNSYFGEYLKSLALQNRTISKIAFTNWGLNITLIFFTGALCLYYWSASLISVGIVSSVIALVLRLYTMSFWIIWEVSGLSEQLGAIKNSLSSIRLAKSIDRNIGAALMSFTEKDFSISFNSICFGFEPSKLIFNSFNLNIDNKEKIGIVGESGSGKSTLVKLLMGLYPISLGHIKIGGKDIGSLTHSDIAANVSVVTQDVELLNRSIYENIAYGAKNATLEQVVEASKLACAHDFIADLEDEQGKKAYDYVVGEKGRKLSGGQRQRIALARAILKDSPIVILDEATSALDSVTEAAIMKNLKELIKHKTFIFITHRLANVRMMDRVIVLQSGRAVEAGDHESLVRSNGVYSSLWNAQMSHFA